MPQHRFTSETGRAAVRRRHDNATDEQRRDSTRPAREARVQVKDVAEKVDLIGIISTDMLAELRALRAEVAELRSERVAA